MNVEILHDFSGDCCFVGVHSPGERKNTENFCIEIFT